MNNPSMEGGEWLRRYVPAAEVTYSPPCKGGAGGDCFCADESPSNSPFARGRIGLPQAFDYRIYSTINLPN